MFEWWGVCQFTTQQRGRAIFFRVTQLDLHKMSAPTAYPPRRSLRLAGIENDEHNEANVAGLHTINVEATSVIAAARVILSNFSAASAPPSLTQVAVMIKMKQSNHRTCIISEFVAPQMAASSTQLNATIDSTDRRPDAAALFDEIDSSEDNDDDSDDDDDDISNSDVDDDPIIIIEIKNSTGATFPIRLQASESVLNLKMHVAALSAQAGELHAYAYRQKITRFLPITSSGVPDAAAAFENERSLASYGVGTGDMLMMTVSKVEPMNEVRFGVHCEFEQSLPREGRMFI